MHNNRDKDGEEIVKMFRHSIAPYSKKLVALHPHLYGSLYRRASEIQALDKILTHLSLADDEAQAHRYGTLPPILLAIKDALHGQAPLSWWNLFTATVGYALRGANDEAKNAEEIRYLTQISDILTRIIRSYQSPNTKFLLEIRLTALEVDARLLELEKIPEGIQEINQTFEYLVSEFQLVTEDLKKVILLPPESWSHNSSTLLNYVAAINRLMEILHHVEITDPKVYHAFIQQEHIQNLKMSIEGFLRGFSLESSDELWEQEQLDRLFELIAYFPDLILLFSPKELYNFLGQVENLFLANPNFNKVRPAIFYSAELKNYVNYYSQQCKQSFEHLCAVAKGRVKDYAVSKDPVKYYKNYFVSESDLHHLSTLIHVKPKEFAPVRCDPEAIQREILNRLVILANLSQPKDLDTILKSFSDEEKENRYFLIQEVILEQFIRWRKLGIY